MKIWITVEDANRTVIGGGPLYKVQRWIHRARMDKAGDFEVHLSAKDKRAVDLIDHLNYLKLYTIAYNNTLSKHLPFLLRGGIVHEMNIISARDGQIDFIVRGSDVMADLGRYMVDSLDIDVGDSGPIASIMSYAGGSWVQQGDEAAIAGSPIKIGFNYLTVLEALTGYARMAGSHFGARMEPSFADAETLYWYRAGDDMSWSLPGTQWYVRAVSSQSRQGIVAPGGDIDVVLATDVEVIEESYSTLSRVYAFGGGIGPNRIHAGYGTAWPDGTAIGSTYTDSRGDSYTHDGTAGIINTTTEAIYGRRDGHTEWPQIIPIVATGNAYVDAGNSVIRHAVAYLRERARPRRWYRIKLADHQHRPIYPPSTMDLDFVVEAEGELVKEYREEDLTIIEVTEEITSGGIRTTSLLTATVDSPLPDPSDYLIEQAQFARLASTQDQFGGKDLGTAAKPLDRIYATTIDAPTIIGSTIGGAEWEFAGNMIIDANSASNTTLSIVNQGAGAASLSVENDITLGGTVDGVFLAGFKTAYDVHAADAGAHHDAVTAGDGINLSGQQVSVDVTDIIDTDYGLTESTNNIRVNLAATSGLEFSSGALQVDDAIAGAGLSIASKVLAVNVGDGLEIATDTVQVDLTATSGLEFSSGDLQIADSIAGAGLAIASKVLAVGAGDGIDVAADAISVDVTDIIDTDYGLTENANNIRINLASPNGLEFSGGALQIKGSIAGVGLTLSSQVLAVNAGDGIAIVADNVTVNEAYAFAWTAVHSFSPGSATAPFTLSANAQGQTVVGFKADQLNKSVTAGAGLTGGGGLTASITLNIGEGNGIVVSADAIAVDLATNSGLTFSSGNLTLGAPTTLTTSTTNSITTSTHAHAIITTSNTTSTFSTILAGNASGHLTLARLLTQDLRSQSSDLVITPANRLVLADSKEFRETTFADSIPIDGFRMFEASDGQRQLTIGKVKADEIRTRVFVADETRVDRGEEYVAKDYAILAAAFTTPSVSSTATITFEDSPQVTGAIFDNNDWILLRIFDNSSGLEVVSLWGQVATYVDNMDGTQSYTYTHRSGTTSYSVKNGAIAIGFGASGQGWILTSALDSSGGPFVRIGSWSGANPYTPSNQDIRTQIGQLNGLLDYASSVYGIAAGDDLGIGDITQFHGFSVDTTSGIRIFNGDIRFYESGNETVFLTETEGLRLAARSDYVLDSAITFYDFVTVDDSTADFYNVFTGDTNTLWTFVGGFASRESAFRTWVEAGTGEAAYIDLRAFSDNSDAADIVRLEINDATGWGFVNISGDSSPVLHINVITDRVGINTSSPNHNFEVAGASAPTIAINVTGAGSSILRFMESNTSKWHLSYSTANNRFGLTETGVLERMSLVDGGGTGFGIANPDGNFHIHTATAGAVTASSGADDLVVENNTHGGMTLLAPDASNSNLYFGSPSNSSGALIRWNYNAALMTIGSASSGAEVAIVSGSQVEAIRIDSAGYVGIRDANPGVPLSVYGNTASGYVAQFDQDHATGDGVKILVDSSSSLQHALSVENADGTLLDVLANGYIGIGIQNAEGPMHITGAGSGNYGVFFLDDLSTTPVELISSSNPVTVRARVEYCTSYSGGGSGASGDNVLTPSSTMSIFTGSGTFTLTCSAGGVVSAARSAGTGTVDAVLKIMWV